MTIDANELRRKLRSDDLIDHIDIHANVKSALAELMDRLEAAEKECESLRQGITFRDDVVATLAVERDTLRIKAEAARTAWKEADKSCYDLTEKVIPNLRNQLEAAERERDWQAERCEEAMTECDSLRAAVRHEADCVEAAKAEIDALRAENSALVEDMNLLRNNNVALRAKIEHMERQEPFDADHPEFRRAFDAALKTGNWPTERKNFGYRSPMSQIAWQVAFCTVNNLKLYALPGAQGEEK